MQTMGTSTLQGTKRPTQINDSVPRIAPKWLKHDRQVSQDIHRALAAALGHAREPVPKLHSVEINYYTLTSANIDLNTRGDTLIKLLIQK